MKGPPQRAAVEGAAKVNIGWRVGPRRNDGFHDVSGLIQTISVIDRVEVMVRDDDGPLVTVEVPGHPELETDDNLVGVAARVLAPKATVRPVRIVVHKQIPIAAGLGGGSADAAAALLGLATVWGAKITARDLIDLAGEVGSDVAAIVRGGLVHASGRGERVSNAGSFDNGWLVLGISSRGISTKDAYDTFDRLDAEPRSALHHNDLEAAACELDPGLGSRLAAMRDAARVAFVSGSGPTVVGVAPDEPAARSVAQRVTDVFDDVLLAQPIGWGVRLQLGT